MERDVRLAGSLDPLETRFERRKATAEAGWRPAVVLGDDSRRMGKEHGPDRDARLLAQYPRGHGAGLAVVRGGMLPSHLAVHERCAMSTGNRSRRTIRGWTCR